jgi:hypothetical protein
MADFHRFLASKFIEVSSPIIEGFQPHSFLLNFLAEILKIGVIENKKPLSNDVISQPLSF